MRRAFIPSVPARYDPLSNKKIPTIDLRPVQHFGEPILLVPVGGAEEPQRLIAEGLRGFTEDDYIVAVGDPVLIAAAAYWAQRYLPMDSSEPINMLRWNRYESAYELVPMEVEYDFR